MEFSFLSLAFRRLKSTASLTLLLVLSFVLTIGMLICVPVFSGAVSVRLMMEELSERAEHRNIPAFSLLFLAFPSSEQPMTIGETSQKLDWIENLLTTHLGLPLESTYAQAESRLYSLRPWDSDAGSGKETQDEIRVVATHGIKDHIVVAEGAPYGPREARDALPVWLERHYAEKATFQIGQTYALGPRQGTADELIPVEVVGFWEARDTDETYWSKDPVYHFRKALLVTPEHFEQYVYPMVPEKTSFNYWYYVLDESEINLDRAERYIEALQLIADETAREIPGGKLYDAPWKELARGQQRKLSLELVLVGFAVPLFGILLYFVASVAAIAVRFQRREVAMLSSRGSSRDQILLLIVLETAVLLGVAVPLSILVGMALARFMGYSLSFLRFSFREPLDVHLVSADWRFVLIAVVLCFATRLWATWRASQLSVVDVERQTARPPQRNWATRVLYTGLMMAVTYYAYRQLLLKGTLGMVRWDINDPSNDPLLLLAPTLFLMTAPLLAAELFVWLMRPLAWLSKAFRLPTLYVGATNLGREGRQYRTPIYLMALCLTLGIFYASVAKSADRWLVDRRRYEIGADLTFREGVGDLLTTDPTTDLPDEASGSPRETSPGLPVSEYETIEGVVEATRVGEFKGTVRLGKNYTVRIMAIDRTSFPRVAYYRQDFARHSLDEMMDRLGIRSDGILVPAQLAEQEGLDVGDNMGINVLVAQDRYRLYDFSVVDVFDHFPTVSDDELTVVANAPYLDPEAGSTFLNGVWMRLAPGAQGQKILGEIVELGVDTNRTHDLDATILRDQQRLERVGIFGLLSICFLAGALLSGISLLVYNFAAMVSRSFRFAVLRAVGMTREEVMGTVSIEYMATLAYGVVAGTLLGLAASFLYVPLFPLTDAPEVPIPPFIPLMDWQSTAWMAAVMALTLILIEGIILIRIGRQRLFEVLRLGVSE